MFRTVWFLSLIAIVVPVASLRGEEIEQIRKQLRSPDPDERFQGCLAANQLKDEAAGLSREIIQCVCDPFPLVKLQAAECLKRIRPDLFPHIMTIASDDNAKGVFGALFELSKMEEKAEVATPAIVHALRSQLSQVVQFRANEEVSDSLIVCEFVVRVLLSKTARKDVTCSNVLIHAAESCLRYQLEGTGVGRELVVIPCWILRDQGKHSESVKSAAIPLYSRIITQSPIGYERQIAVECLADLSPGSQATLRLLKDHRFDRDADVRTAVEQAIERIEAVQKDK